MRVLDCRPRKPKLLEQVRCGQQQRVRSAEAMCLGPAAKKVVACHLSFWPYRRQAEAL